jgi:hypothetical protein
MAVPPISYFRKEDFPELKDEPWAQRLFSRLNGMARQTQYGLDKNITVQDNLSAFWWTGIVGAYTRAAYPNAPYSPFVETTVTPPTTKNASSIRAFPFTFPNKLLPKRVGAILVAQVMDVTDTAKQPLPAMVGGVSWTVESDNIKIYGINGMLQDRSYQTKLLVLGE